MILMFMKKWLCFFIHIFFRKFQISGEPWAFMSRVTVVIMWWYTFKVKLKNKIHITNTLYIFYKWQKCKMYNFVKFWYFDFFKQYGPRKNTLWSMPWNMGFWDCPPKPDRDWTSLSCWSLWVGNQLLKLS